MTYRFDDVGNVLGYTNDCLSGSQGRYSTSQSYSYDGLYQLLAVRGETVYNPHNSLDPEYRSTYTQEFTFDDAGLGNMMSKVSTESVSPQKSIGDDLNYALEYSYDESYAHRLRNVGNRYYQYDSNGNIICEQEGSFDENSEPYIPVVKTEGEDVYSSDYGWGLFKESSKGSPTGEAGYRRVYTWNERNQLISSVDSLYNTAYVYGQDGQRSNKYTDFSETLYFNSMWTHHTDTGNSIYGGQTAKNIYLGETRIVTKLNSGNDPTSQEEYYKQYYYHSDHLGSAQLITDYKGDEYQRIEYTPYGETWVEKTSNTGSEFLPYKFTGKELDPETGLYYYGARYLDPKYSIWLSADPALGEYIPGAPVNEEAKKRNGNLPGMGGVFNTVNLHLYHYAGNNPVKYVDPDGRWTDKMKAAVDAAVGLGKTYTHGTWNPETKKTEGAWDCDVFVQYIINLEKSGASLPSSFKEATETNVATHLTNMKDDLKDAPEKGTNIVFHGGNHAMLLGLNDDGSVDVTHISSTNEGKKASNIRWTSLKAFEDHWKKQGNGELKYVPLNDYITPQTESTSIPNVNDENKGSGK